MGQKCNTDTWKIVRTVLGSNMCHSGEQGCKANDLWRWSSQKEDRKMEVITSKLK